MTLTSVDQELGSCLFGVTPEYLQPSRAKFGCPTSSRSAGSRLVPGAAGPSATDLRPRARDIVQRGQWGGTLDSGRLVVCRTVARRRRSIYKAV
jgi:hypothetical protein